MSSPSFLNKVAVVTGGGSGIGRALCLAFAKAGACVVVVDVRGSREVFDTLVASNHLHFECDVTNQAQVQQMIREVKQRYGRIDVYCSNAGILMPSSTTNDSVAKHSMAEWDKIMHVNVLSHVVAFRELVEDWERGVGDAHFCVTASAAGLLTMVGDASYGVSKAAALSLCEHMAIAHSAVKVHCLCPQAVDTPMVDGAGRDDAKNAAMTDGVMSAPRVAQLTLQGIESGDFFIFPHTQVPKYALRKAQDHDRWLKGMQRLRNTVMGKPQVGNRTATQLRAKL